LQRAEKGFTLVELIIVIAILAALVGILAPQYIRYLEKSRAVVCQSNLDNAAHAYEVALVDAQSSGGASDYAALMKEVVEGMGGSESGARLYKGLCPTGGLVAAVFDSEGGVTLSCSKHADAVSRSSVYSTKLLNIVTSGLTRPNGSGTQSLMQYLGSNSQNKTIDSEAGATSGNTTSWTSIIGGQMENLAGDQSWQIVGSRDGKSCTVYITTDGKITGSAAGSTVTVRKYVYVFGTGANGSGGTLTDAGSATAKITSFTDKTSKQTYNRLSVS